MAIIWIIQYPAVAKTARPTATKIRAGTSSGGIFRLMPPMRKSKNPMVSLAVLRVNAKHTRMAIEHMDLAPS
jgi:hypothetical protein